MNIIREQRESIIRENNTAQEKLLDILEYLNKRTRHLNLLGAWHGDLDFSILTELGFTFITSISLEEGEITNVINIPEGVTSFICPRNLLFSLDCPSSLTHLEIPHNYLPSIELSQCIHLKHLNISHNNIGEIENLPSEITELYCENNELKHLDLRGLLELNVLHISNNNISIIENLPENITDFEMDNNPSIEFRNSPVIPQLNKDETGALNVKQNLNYVDALNSYFKLKNEYEKKLYVMKKKAFDGVSPNKKAGKRLAALVKGKCINCKRPVETIFSIKDKRYMAICGDVEQPCNLKIEIYNGSFSPTLDLLYFMKDDIDTIKNNIIKQKLDVLFSYTNEENSVPLFKRELENYNLDSKIYEELLDNYNETHHSKHRNELIQKKKNIIFRYIESNRELLNEYKTSENHEILKTAVQLQIDNLLPETRNLRYLSTELVELNDKIHKSGRIESFLFKNDVVLSKLGFNSEEPARVIQFQKT